ncbi:hypothetical protein [Achromobacter sp. ESBL13]|uniref:hypothetical protein n=1 Tax=Achromobacter sp. ESBL13 TaxID=3077328 RepID=UPI002FC8A989
MTTRTVQTDAGREDGNASPRKPSHRSWLRALLGAALDAASMFHGPDFPADPSAFNNKRPRQASRH